MNREKNLRGNVLLLAAVILELCFTLYFFKTGVLGQGLSATGLFATGAGIGALLLFKFYDKPVAEVPLRRSRYGQWLVPVLLLAALTLLLPATLRVLQQFPIDFHLSDIIPTIKILVERWMQGTYPYEPIDKFGYHLQVTYMPLQWMPFRLAAAWHFDYRFVSLGIWLLAAVLLCRQATRKVGTAAGFLCAALLWLHFWMILQNDGGIIGMTVELMVAGYYMMMMMGLNSRNGYLQGLTLALCLLSRFSLILWLPLWLLVQWRSGKRKMLLASLGTIVAVVLVLYVIPFMSKDWLLFYKGYKSYDVSAIGEWQHLNEAGKPTHLYDGKGFAWLFYQRDSWPLEIRLKTLQRTHLWACLGISLLLAVLYVRKRGRWDTRIFLMGSFKIYLSVFLAFIQVPYTYLMIVGSFVSIALFAQQLRYRVVPAGAAAEQ